MSKRLSKEVENKEGKEHFNNMELVYYYGYLLSQLQYEGNGIWSRFNVMMGLNVSLFGLITFLFSTAVANKDVLILITSIGGLLFSIWSLAVLKRLWIYHYHWKDNLENLEKMLPDNLVKPFTKIPFTRKNLEIKSRSVLRVWLKSYTQPFFGILVFLWLSIIITSLQSIIKGREDIKKDVAELRPNVINTTGDNNIKRLINKKHK